MKRQCDTSSWIKNFGTGTKLIVSGTEAKFSPSKTQVLPPFTEKDGKVTHICLIEDFYPNIIKVTWEDDKEKEEKNAVYGEIWPSDDDQPSYSMCSWLTVDKNSNKNYRCKYQHEAKEKGFATIESQETSIVPKTTAGCTNRLFTVSFMHRTAYLIYTVLLLKSTIYYVIVLFFMYRMQSPIKHQGKKP